MYSRFAGLMALGLLAACGTNPQERVTGGAAAGAATGAGIGALGGPAGALAGAAIGGGAGAVTGAATSPSEVNLGRPLWNDPEVRVPGDSRSTATRRAAPRSDTRTRDVQQALSRQGYDVGAIDGVNGPRTREALSDWQRRNNLPVTGTADARTMAALGTGSSMPPATSMPPARGSSATGTGMPPSGAVGGGTTRSAPIMQLPPGTTSPGSPTTNREGGAAGGGGASGTGQ